MSGKLNEEIMSEGILMDLKLKYNLEELSKDIISDEEKDNILKEMFKNFDEKLDIDDRILILLEMRKMIENGEFYTNDAKIKFLNYIKTDPEFHDNKILNFEYLLSEIIFLNKLRLEKIMIQKYPSLSLLDNIDKNSLGNLNYRNVDYHKKASIQISFYPEIQSSRRMLPSTVMIVGNNSLRDKFKSNDKVWLIGLDLNIGLNSCEVMFEYNNGWEVILLSNAYNSIKIRRKNEINSLRIRKNDLCKSLKLKKYDEIHIGVKSLLNKKERFHKLVVSHLLNEDLRDEDEMSVLTSEE